MQTQVLCLFFFPALPVTSATAVSVSMVVVSVAMVIVMATVVIIASIMAAAAVVGAVFSVLSFLSNLSGCLFGSWSSESKSPVMGVSGAIVRLSC